jgi:hypothetical protein
MQVYCITLSIALRTFFPVRAVITAVFSIASNISENTLAIPVFQTRPEPNYLDGFQDIGACDASESD